MSLEVLAEIEESRPSLRERAEALAHKAATGYFSSRDFERADNGRVYEYLGVHVYKKFLPTEGDYVCRFAGFRPATAGPRIQHSLERYVSSTKVFEAIHLGMIPVMLGISVGNIASRDYSGLAITTAINLAINIYPIMTQRYNRARVTNILEGRYKKAGD